MRATASGAGFGTSGTIHLNFEGYWRDSHREWVPAASGVYCVYRCAFDRESGTLRPLQLLHVGESVDARAALRSGPERRHWLARLEPEEELCFSFAPAVLGRQLAAFELAMRHRPPCNPMGGNLSPLRSAPRVILSGKIALLSGAASGDESSAPEAREKPVSRRREAKVLELGRRIEELPSSA